MFLLMQVKCDGIYDYERNGKWHCCQQFNIYLYPVNTLQIIQNCALQLSLQQSWLNLALNLSVMIDFPLYQVVGNVSRLCIDLHMINSWALKAKKDLYLCQNCTVLLTVMHLLVECLDFQCSWKSCFSHVPSSNVSLRKLLVESDTYCTFDLSSLVYFLLSYWHFKWYQFVYFFVVNGAK